MRITDLLIKNFKSIGDMHITDIENALILVGKNNTGKTGVLDAIRAVCGEYRIRPDDFQRDYPNIEIAVTIRIFENDLQSFHEAGLVSSYRNFDSWYRKFRSAFPSFVDQEGEKYTGDLRFTFVANRDGKIRYDDGFRKQNANIEFILPTLYYIDSNRDLEQFQSNLLLLQEDRLLQMMRSGCCMFSTAKPCDHCFSCIGLINQKKPEELNAFEAAKLLDYKLYQLNLDDFSAQLNANYRKNGGQDRIVYSMNRDIKQMLAVTAEIYRENQKSCSPIEHLGKGMRSIYMLSLLETCASEKLQKPGVILVEEPELFLHPRLQKISGDILYRLARNNQVVFSTHSANLLPDFNSRQIRQIVLDQNGYSNVRAHTNISVILDDLGYSAGDLMNVDFVFIVEGRQDKTRLPLLLEKYYSEIYDKNGRLSRAAIITTNSCTNIKTYANLKYMNQIYLKDNFLMIRDGDGKDPNELKRQLCRYYEERDRADIDKLPRVTEKNVLILRYYSFENYFFNPEIMAKLGVIPTPEDFYRIFLIKWKEYLHRLTSGEKLRNVIGRDFETVEDVKNHMEEIRIYLRGHNLYDLFYGKFKKKEEELLRNYIDLADRNDFKDILDAIDRFIFFEGRKKTDSSDSIR